MSIKIASVTAACMAIAGSAWGEEPVVAAAGATQVSPASGPAAAASVSSAPPPAYTAWQFGFRAGWAKDFFNGSTDNVSILGAPMLAQRIQESRGWHYGQNEVDLAVDAQTPEYWSNVAFFMTLGGGLSVGTTEKEGARAGRPGFNTTVAASIEDNGMFYMHIGPSFRIDLPWEKQYFDLRPHTGFSVYDVTGRLGVFQNGAADPVAESQSSKTYVNPLLGIEAVFHLDCPIFSACQPHPYGLDAYVSYDHSFNTAGQSSVQGTTAQGVQYSGEYNHSNSDRIAAGIQFHFNAPWQ